MQPDFKHMVKLFDRINSAVNALPSKIATEAVNFSKERFVKKNWHDRVPEPWKKTRKRKGSTLVSSGRLKKSIRKIHVSPEYVSIGSDVAYARIHNDGGVLSGVERVKSHIRRGHKRKGYVRPAHVRTIAGRQQNVSQHKVRLSFVKSYKVKSHSRKYHRKFEKRQFIGKSQELNNRIDLLIDRELAQAIQEGIT